MRGLLEMANNYVAVDLNKAVLFLLVVLTVLCLVNSIMVSRISSRMESPAPKPKAPAASPAAQPSQSMNLTIIVPKCETCVNLSTIAAFLNANFDANLNSREIDASSSEAKELIAKYSIARLPSAVLQANLSSPLPGFVPVGDASVFLPEPPYLDMKSGIVKGRVTVVSIVPECSSCVNISLVLLALRNNGIYFEANKTVGAASDEGKRIIKNYNITKLPTMIFSKDALDYSVVNRSWPGIGTVELDDKLVLRRVPPPFLDLETNSVKGIVDITWLTDSTCSECYNVSVHKDFLLTNFALKVGSERTVDVSSADGRALAKKYSIELVPTYILSAEAQYYSSLVTAWKDVGIAADDGSFVFTNLGALVGYAHKNLTSGKIVNVSAPEAAAAS
jgi:hypothetical protein